MKVTLVAVLATLGACSRTSPPSMSAPAVHVASLPGASGGALDEALLRELRGRVHGLQSCAELAARAGELSRGKMVITLTIEPSGTVRDVRLDAGSLTATALGGCVKSRVSAWVFPARHGVAQTYTYPFLFVAGND